MPNTVTIALWALNVGHPLVGLDDFAALVEVRMAEAAGQGADLLMLPEYVAEHWLWFAPQPLARPAELDWMARQAEEVVPRLAPLPKRHGIALLAGAMPVRKRDARPGGPRHRNRAHLFLPDGRAVTQDKLCLLPVEANPQGYWLEPGETVRIVSWRGVRIAIAVCLDIELPALAARLAGADLDLLLVPSMTEKLSGFQRVSGCARARAIELMTTVCVVGCVGTADHPNARPSVGGAAVYLPCEESLGSAGVAAEMPPTAVADGPGPLLIARDLPVGRIRALRAAGAEAWPGAWSADHVGIEEV
jgi:predicted amidohydrolase